MPRPYRRSRLELGHLKEWQYRKLYQAAWAAISRCTDSTHHDWDHYGGRGVEVRFADLDEFILHLASLPGADIPGLLLDRADNAGHYEAGNLRWVTRSESNRNCRPRTPYKLKGPRRLRRTPEEMLVARLFGLQ